MRADPPLVFPRLQAGTVPRVARYIGVGLVALTIASVAAAAAYGGTAEERVVRIEATGPDGRHVVAVAHAKANGREAPLAWVESLVPDPLPATLALCLPRTTAGLVIVFADGQTVRYGSCLPRRIEWLRDALFADTRRWSALAAGPPAIVGGRSAEKRELQRLIRELGLTSLRRIDLKANERRVRMSVPGRDLRTAWEAALLSRLYNAAAARRHVRTLDLFGAFGSNGGSILYPGIGQPASDLERVQRFVAAVDAEVVELRVLAGAVAMTVRTAHPAAFLKYHGNGFLDAFAQPQPPASMYLTVEDTAGAIVYRAARFRGMSVWGARPDLWSCAPGQGSVSTVYQPPPCPA
jgi:hypothetical protein